MKENSVEEDIINAQRFINSIKTDKDLKEENNAFRSVIDTYNIPNNLDTRFEVE